MLREFYADNRRCTQFLRLTHGVCDGHNDVATASLIDVWIDQAERRAWFLAEIVGCADTPADGATIVLNASIVASTGNPAFSVYSVTKAAVRSFARTWAVDLKERKIRVNAISPGIVPTPGYNTSFGMTQDQVTQFVDASIGGIPLGRAGTPDEIAKAVVFLASDQSSYVNGIELFVDGGLAQI